MYMNHNLPNPFRYHILAIEMITKNNSVLSISGVGYEGVGLLSLKPIQ